MVIVSLTDGALLCDARKSQGIGLQQPTSMSPYMLYGSWLLQSYALTRQLTVPGHFIPGTLNGCD